jgi:hypothetical protein
MFIESARLRPHSAPTTGSTVYIWEQSERQALVPVYLPQRPCEGPCDGTISVAVRLDGAATKSERDTKSRAPAHPDMSGDFAADIDGDPFCADLVHVYAVARVTLNMFLADLGITDADWRWHWEHDGPRSPLRVLAHAGDRVNASYHRGKRALRFFHFNDGGRTRYLCRSMDVVAHETGHAILDAWKPQLYAAQKGEQAAFHEAFADLAAFFARCAVSYTSERALRACAGDLRAGGHFSTVGDARSYDKTSCDTAAEEDCGMEISDGVGVRDLNNNLTGDSCGTDVYAMASVFTGFIFDVVVDCHKLARDRHCVKELGSIVSAVRRCFVLALLKSGESPVFAEVASTMERIANTVPSDFTLGKAMQNSIRDRAADRKLTLIGLRRQRVVVDLGPW